MPRTVESVDVFQAIADANRRRILDVLRAGEQPVGNLVASTGLSYSLVSQHLRVLLGARTVVCRPHGRQRFYRLDPSPLRLVRDWTAEYDDFWQESITRLRRRLDR